MSDFAKIVTVDGHQVVAHKDFEDRGDYTSYQVVTLIYADGGAQRIAYGYQDEAKRDAKFDAFDEEGARVSLNVILEAFGK